jgi:hypothetical protein
VVKDDGEPEVGYGWVPSVVEGIYVQEFRVAELPGRDIERVCVCWMRTREDSELAFDVVVYGDAGGVPLMTPFLVVPTVASDVPLALDGAFYEVDIGALGVDLPGDVIYVGARWDPSVDQYFFVCADKSPGTPEVNGFYIDDRADEWGSLLESSDPNFTDHRALLVRAVGAQPQPPGIPTVGGFGIVVFVMLVAGLAILRLR